MIGHERWNRLNVIKHPTRVGNTDRVLIAWSTWFTHCPHRRKRLWYFISCIYWVRDMPRVTWHHREGRPHGAPSVRGPGPSWGPQQRCSSDLFGLASCRWDRSTTEGLLQLQKNSWKKPWWISNLSSPSHKPKQSAEPNLCTRKVLPKRDGFSRMREILPEVR